jgi:Arc/MetJ family transcription regulator
MGGTNIDIDDELIERVMRRYRLPSKRAAVELALRRLAGEPMSRDEALAMEGAGWSGDLDDLREPAAVTGSGDAPAAGS